MATPLLCERFELTELGARTLQSALADDSAVCVVCLEILLESDECERVAGNELAHTRCAREFAEWSSGPSEAQATVTRALIEALMAACDDAGYDRASHLQISDAGHRVNVAYDILLQHLGIQQPRVTLAEACPNARAYQ